MKNLKRLAFGSLILPLVSAAAVSNNNNHPQTNVTWGPCENAPSPFECATVQVPLDWGARNKGMIPLSVIRLPASSQPRQGYMFFNPGGPSEAGTDFLAEAGERLQGQIGASWDLVSWDPRGVLKSGPNITLFSTDEEYYDFWNQLEGKDRLNAHGNLTTQADADFFLSQAPAFDSFAKQLNSLFVQKNGDKLKYIGSCAVVRDLVALTEMLYGQGADVNFWGISYGTILASYLTQMFPNRVGKVIIDDSYLWANKVPMDWTATDLETTEQALIKWSGICAAHPTKCTIATKTDGTAEGVYRVTQQILEVAYKNYDGTVWTPLNANNATIMSNPRKWNWSQVSQQIFFHLYRGSEWLSLNEVLEGLVAEQASLTNTTTSKRGLSNLVPMKRGLSYSLPMVPGYGILPANRLNLVVIAIACGDAIDVQNRTTEDLFRNLITISRNESSTFTSTQPLTNPRPFCHHWSSRAVERLPKRMNIKPKNVVLVIGNSEDVITPYSSARTLASSARLGNKARLVKFNAVGHASSSHNSTCIDEVVRKFVNGSPPADAGNDEADVECNVDRTLFD
ncbi:hypothetical protein CPB86DRAFT_784504 [Serendipita vermifera]|nr:hypothetical protein CPB86DRAFT_784504 [Serendipita vermifera]